MNKGTILVVDDTLASLKLLTDILAAEGYDIRPADSGELALASVASSPPELILLDIRMPGMDGFEVCRRLKKRKESRGIPILFITATTEPDERLEGLRLGAVDCIAKPFQREELLARAGIHLELARLRTKLETQVAERTAELQQELAERKRTEQRLRQLSRAVEQSPSSVMITDTKGNIEYVNPKFVAITGYSPDEVYGKNPRVLKSGAQPPQTYEEMWKTICAGREWRGEFYNKKKNGEFFWESASICPITDENGVITHFLGVKEDISERKSAELAILESKHLAERANQAKDDFIAALSHELRTPLTPVLLTASALQDEETLSPDFRNQIGLIRHNIQLEARLIDDLLDVSKIAHGKISLQSEGVDIHALLSKAVDIMREDIVRNALTIQVEAGAGHALTYGDPARLQQVFWNLLKNAVKFTPSGGSIHVRTFNPDTQTLFVEFRDTGIGIEPKFLEKIFRPFEQGATSGDHRYGGLGLGLSISQAIVKLHGGTLSASSEGLNHGATFAVCLPVSKTARLAQPPPSTAPVKKATLFHILLVEDDENTRMVLARLLTRDGHHVEAVGTCAAAIESAKATANGQAKPFEALISDIGLPDGSGLDVAREIKALTPEIRAIALSGYGTEADILNSNHAGFSAHLTKPISFEELRHALAT